MFAKPQKILSKKMKKNELRRRKYKAVIIGAGRIASGFDAPGNKKILTHAHALKKHPAIDLVGFFDKDKQEGEMAAKKWGCLFFDSLEEAMETKPDIATICVSSEYHYSVLRAVIKFNPMLVICEKPLTKSLAESEKIIKLYRQAGIPILINYFRRFDSAVQAVKREIEANKYGRVLCASGSYTKGVFNNGSHTLDLARFLFGEIKKLKPLYRLNDYVEDDPSVAGFIEFAKCPQFHLMVGDSRAYKIREFDILLEKAALSFIEDGMFLMKRKVGADKVYAGYKVLRRGKIVETGYNRAMLGLVENAVDYLEGGSSLLCDAAEALKDQKACVDLLEGIKNNF